MSLKGSWFGNSSHDPSNMAKRQNRSQKFNEGTVNQNPPQRAFEIDKKSIKVWSGCGIWGKSWGAGSASSGCSESVGWSSIFEVLLAENRSQKGWSKLDVACKFPLRVLSIPGPGASGNLLVTETVGCCQVSVRVSSKHVISMLCESPKGGDGCSGMAPRRTRRTRRPVGAPETSSG